MNLNKDLTLSELPIGVVANIIYLKHGVDSSKLIALGFANGATVVVLRKSLFGKSYMVKVNSYFAGLRAEEMEDIIVRVYE